ncbi:MAG: thiamine-phosphate kinase [Planctomycetota bacterium]
MAMANGDETMNWNELDIIDWLTMHSAASLSGEPTVIVGPGDDAAVVRIDAAAENDVLFCADAIAETIHFILKDGDRSRSTSPTTEPLVAASEPYQIGWKLIAENISDIAAMGGTPRFSVATCHSPKTIASETLKEIFKGLSDCARRFGVFHVGGDLIRSSDSLSLSLALIGDVPRGKALLRSGAKPGDRLFVTGSLGGSILFKHHDFMPRIEEGKFLSKNGLASACIDITDGLALDLTRLLRASGDLGVRLYADAIPVSDAARLVAATTGRSPLKCALSDGEDFELLFTVPDALADELPSRWSEHGGLAPLTSIGVICEPTDGRQLLDANGNRTPLLSDGYVH